MKYLNILLFFSLGRNRKNMIIRRNSDIVFIESWKICVNLVYWDIDCDNIYTKNK